MGRPSYEGMPPSDIVYEIDKPGRGTWGRIRCGGPCRDDYKRLMSQSFAGGALITLQEAAMSSFMAAQKAVGAPIRVTGSMRGCAYQTHLHNADPNRFADPDTSAHCRGLAIDVDQSQSRARLAAVRKALLARAWYQARPTDEPWHFSFGIQV